jgi:hypothetical protein
MKNEMTNPTSLTSLPQQWVERLFQRMHATYGTRWTDLWRDVPPEVLAATWGDSLSGLTTDEIKSGLSRMGKFPPTPVEFRDLCRPPLNARRSYDEALTEMRKRHDNGSDNWSHPAIYWAAVVIGGDLRKLPYQQLEKRWTEVLADCVECVHEGRMARDIPKKLVELPAPATSVNPEAVAKLVATVNAPKGLDGHAWARKIIERHEEGQYTYVHGLMLARQVLGIESAA